VSSTSRRGGPIVSAAFALLGMIVLIGLGTWQIERKAWKEGLIATLDRRLNEAPVALPPPEQWSALAQNDTEFTRVRLHVTFPGAGDALVYAGGSSVRDDVKEPGYFVFSLARLPDGRQIAVNRGFTLSRSYPAPPASQEIVGSLRWPEAPSWFVAAHDTSGEIWTARDTPAMASLKQWGTIAPFYIEQEAPVPPGGVPHPAPLTIHLRNEHLQYAITWYGLAAALAVMFVIGMRKRRRESPR